MKRKKTSRVNFIRTDPDPFFLLKVEFGSGSGGNSTRIRNPKFQKKLQEEIDEAYEANGGKLPDYNTIQSLPYLGKHTTCPIILAHFCITTRQLTLNKNTWACSIN